MRQELAAANPTDALDRRNLADQYMLLGNSQSENGDVSGALEGYRQSLANFKALSLADASNAEARRDLSFVYQRLAAVWAKMGNVAAARESYGEALRIAAQLHHEDPANTEDIQTLESLYEGLGKVLEKAGDLTEAINNYLQARGALEKHIAATSGNPALRGGLANYATKIGSLYARLATLRTTRASQQLEFWREARSYFQKSYDICQDMRHKGMLCDVGDVASQIARCDAALVKLK